MSEEQKAKKALFDTYANKKMEEIRLELEGLFPGDKSEFLLGGFGVAVLVKVSEENPPLYNGMVAGLVRHRNDILPSLAH